MKKNLNTKSNFFCAFYFVLPIAFLLLSSIATKDSVARKEATSTSKSELLSCTQSDLIICNYSTIEAFVDALVAELNNQLNYCHGALVDCNQSSTCCYYTNSYFTFQTQLSNCKNPWFYCTNESCNTFTCGVLGGGSQHNDLTVADQDSIITILMNSASTTRNTICNGSSGAINNYFVYRTPSGTPTGPCSSDGPCYNLSIRMRVTYVCTCAE